MTVFQSSEYSPRDGGHFDRSAGFNPPCSQASEAGSGFGQSCSGRKITTSSSRRQVGNRFKVPLPVCRKMHWGKLIRLLRHGAKDGSVNRSPPDPSHDRELLQQLRRFGRRLRSPLPCPVANPEDLSIAYQRPWQSTSPIEELDR